MKVTAVSPMAFKIGFKNNYNTNNTTDYAQYNNKKLSLALGCLAAASIGIIAVKSGIINPKKICDSIKDTFSDSPRPSKILKVLDGRRDKEAVELYNSFLASQKLESLNKKSMTITFFEGKEDKVLKYIKNNKEKLQEKALKYTNL